MTTTPAPPTGGSLSRRSRLALPWAVTRLGFQRQFAYPQAALWGLITN